MQILVLGPAIMLAEWQQQLGEKESIQFIATEAALQTTLSDYQTVCCLEPSPAAPVLEKLLAFEGLLVLNSIFTNLASVHALYPQHRATLCGLNALPTFLTRPLWELSVLQAEDRQMVNDFFQSLGQPVQFVADRVGMATPRVICMIINEAYFTLQEGTATKEDIDLGMQLGTNYPMGPFAWAEKIGLKNVYRLLEAVGQDTGDERYRICPLLKREMQLQG